MVGVYALIDALCKWKRESNADVNILVTGVEGSGKSNFALSLATFLDSSFKKNIANRIAFNINDIDTYLTFQSNRAVKLEKNEKLKQEVFIIDEGQNLLFSRNAMNAEQKKLIQLFRTQRFTKSVVIINTPNIIEIDRAILSRLDAIIIIHPQTKYAFVSLNQLMNYFGTLQTFLEGLFNYKKQTNLVIPMHPDHLYSLFSENNIVPFDCFGRTFKVNPRIWNVYNQLKIAKSLSFINKKQDSFIKNYRIIDAGNGKLRDVPEFRNDLIIFYKYDYYPISIINKYFKVKMKELKALPSLTKKKNKSFVLLSDVFDYRLVEQ